MRSVLPVKGRSPEEVGLTVKQRTSAIDQKNKEIRFLDRLMMTRQNRGAENWRNRRVGGILFWALNSRRASSRAIFSAAERAPVSKSRQVSIESIL